MKNPDLDPYGGYRKMNPHRRLQRMVWETGTRLLHSMVVSRAAAVALFPDEEPTAQYDC